MLSRRRILVTAVAVVVTCTSAAAVAQVAPAPTSAPTPKAATANSSLVGEWHLDELDPESDGPTTTPDSSGNGADLRVITPTAVPGRFGNALNFNAANHDEANIFGPEFQPALITTVAWVKGSNSPGLYKDIVSQGGTSSCALSSYALYTGANGGISFYIATGSTTTVNSTSAMPASVWDGKWHAVAGTFDGTSVRLYVDGAEVGAPTQTTSPIDYLSDNTFEVGNYDYPCQGDFTGAIDEVRVYNRALSAAEVGEIQNSTATTPPELGADPTSTQVNCMPMTVAVGSATSCTATVSDTAAADASAPTGQVAFTSDSPGTFSPATATCTLGSPMGLTSTCSVSYTATALRTGTHQITGAYSSDGSDTPSSGTANLTVTTASSGPPPTPTSPVTTPVTTPPQAVFTAPTSVHLLDPVTLNAGATSGASTLLWSLSGRPAVSCNAATPDLTVRFTTATTVALTAFGAGGSSRTSKSVGVFGGTLGAPVAASALANTAVCSGGAPDVDVTANGGPPAGCSTNVIAGIVSAVGCLTEVTDPNQVPRGEAGILNAMLADYQATPAAIALGHIYNCQNIAKCTGLGFTGTSIRTTRAIIQTLGLYISTQPVRINGVDFTPLHGASIAVSPGMSRVVSSNALVQVGRVPISIGKINLDVKTSCTPGCGNNTLQVASFDAKDLPGLSGDDFPFTGMADISFIVHGTDRYSEIHGHIELPASLGGITVDAKLRVDDTNGITPESFKGTAMNLGFDGIGLTNVLVEYDAPDNWTFYGDLGLGGYQVRLAPTPTEPYNGIVFKNGIVAHAGATLDLSAGPPQIAPGVLLEKISLSFSTKPSAVRGSITLNALGVADVTGSLVLAFPSAGEGFTPGPTDLPGAPAAILHRTYFEGPLVGIGGSADVIIPDIGEVPLGQGYLLYDVGAGYIAAGGQIDTGIKDVVTVTGRVDGEFNVNNRRFNLSGSVDGCLFGVCGTVTGVVSSYGAGICAGDWGGGVLWSDFPTPHIYGQVNAFGISIGKACMPSRFSDNFVFNGHIIGVNAAPTTFVVKRGRPIPEILLNGDTGAPNVSVTGPDGQVLTADGVGVHRGGGMIAVQAASATAHVAETVIGVEGNGEPGTYTITPLPGPNVIGGGQANEPQPTSVHGNVSGAGTRRTLHYAVTGAMPGERVTFSEVQHGISREIGSTSGGHGTLSFTTSPGPDRRTIIAQESVNGLGVPSAQNVFVARFSGPAFVKPSAVSKLSAHFAHGVLTASWQSAPKATDYQVTLREKHGGLITMTTRKHSLRIADATAYLPGTVKVVAVSSDGSLGPAVTASYRAAQAAPSRFLSFSELKPKPKPHKVKAKPKKS